jgi:hypothetical protein
MYVHMYVHIYVPKNLIAIATVAVATIHPSRQQPSIASLFQIDIRTAIYQSNMSEACEAFSTASKEKFDAWQTSADHTNKVGEEVFMRLVNQV